MTEILVRIWDKEEKEMIPFMHVMMFAGWITAKANLGHDLRRYELMQWTGFLDSCGEKIFDGDVLAYDRKDTGGKIVETHLWQVYWDTKKGAWKSVRINNKMDFDSATQRSLWSQLENHRVIGSIYQL